MEGSHRLSVRLISWLKANTPRQCRVAGFYSVKSEPDMMPVLRLLRDEGYPTCLPRIDAQALLLAFHEWKAGDDLQQGMYGIPEPRMEKPATPDVVLVPLVAFDRTGHRLGFGKGYYDVTLDSLRRANPGLLAIGVAFSVQEVPELAPENHDARLDVIVTEKEVILAGGAA